MKIKEQSVKRQLWLSLGAILLFVMLLGGMTLYFTETLWQNTSKLYDHPLTVRRAIADIETGVLRMHRSIKDIYLAPSEEEILAQMRLIEANQALINQQIEILNQRYLGPKSDVEALQRYLAEWEVIRADNIRLVREGRLDEAIQCSRSTGQCGEQVEIILLAIKRISNFAKNKADELHLQSYQSHQSMLAGLWVLLGGILLMTILISLALGKRINEPLLELTHAARQFRSGDTSARSRYTSGNEFGLLSAAFNDLAAHIQAELQNRRNHQSIAEQMLSQDDLHAFCATVLRALLEHTGSQTGAVYLRNQSTDLFEQFESIGLQKKSLAAFSADGFEGEFGQALLSGEIQHLADIPEDTRCVFSTVSGDYLPREIITIPILSGDTVAALVSLSSLRRYSPAALQLVHDVWSVLTARLNGVLAYQKVREFSKILEDQNRELEAQTRELAAQTEELSEQNTELEVQKKQLDEANRLKTVFLSNMSHELRTPLNSVIALSGVLGRRLKDAVAPEEYSYLEVIERNGRQLLELINDILDLSRIEAGKEEVRLASFSINDLITEITTTIEPQAQEKGIDLLNLVQGQSLYIQSDEDKCRHILQNLISNAVKFTNQGKVEVSARQVNEHLKIDIRDTGIGISAEQLPYIFDEFRQADDSTSRQFDGSGLGLAIAKKYTQLLQGRIDVQSTLGAGSTFTLTLPMNIGDDNEDEFLDRETSASISEPIPEMGNCFNKTILLVEDSEPAIIQLSDILSEQGCHIRVAHNGREALEQIAMELPDAVILDLMMPEVDGFEVLRLIRSQARTAKLPVLILTAKHVTHEELSFLQGNHIHQLIQKGDINRQNLLKAVARMLTPPNPAPKPVVLVIENHTDNQTVVAALLADSCQLLQAVDGETGIAMAREKQPDLILLDLSLPKINSLKALQAIRSAEKIRQIPVIAMTARAMKGDREEILAQGFDGYIAKPIDAETLLKTIQEILHGR
jgi:signal transduction histidine kinase/DNA-binding response OmpR family regulator/CHASE3 domain sensor protein